MMMIVTILSVNRNRTMKVIHSTGDIVVWRESVKASSSWCLALGGDARGEGANVVGYGEILSGRRYVVRWSVNDSGHS